MYSHIYNQSLNTPEGAMNDLGISVSGDTSAAANMDVSAHLGADITPDIAFTVAGFKSMGLLSTVPCVVTVASSGGTLTIDGVTTSTITLLANVLRHVSAMGGATQITGLTVGPNTDVAGLSGTITISALFNS